MTMKTTMRRSQSGGEDEEDPEWEAEVTRQQEIGLIKIKVCFTSSWSYAGLQMGRKLKINLFVEFT